MENILLIGKYSSVEPLGLMFLAGALKEEGHQVKIFLFKEPDGSDIVLNSCRENYSFIGFGCYTGVHKIIYRKADILRSCAPVIIGGPHATSFMKECVAHADYVVPGEGLDSIRSITNRLVTPGIVFSPYLIPADYLPFPNRKPVYDAYPELKNSKIKSVITSMGCPFSCFYCYIDTYRNLYPKFKVRQRSVDVIIKECHDLLKYPTELIYFQDDCFGANISWLEEFAKRFKKEVGVPFHCQLRPEFVTPVRSHLLKLAGCHGITMAIETVNDEVRNNLLNRKNSIAQIKSAGDLIKSYDFRFRTEQMLGLPETTLNDELDLLSLNIGLQPDIAWTSVFAPYLGTSLGDWCKANGWYSGTNDDLTDSFFNNTCLNFPKDRARATNRLHRIFSTCAKMPFGRELAKKLIESNSSSSFDEWYQVMRQHLYDECLYKVEGN